MLTPAQELLLRQLSIGEEASLTNELRDSAYVLDERTTALVRLSALIMRDSPLASYQRAINAAFDAGVSVDEMLALLPLLAQLAGSMAVINNAPKLAMALGYDVETGLEELTPYEGVQSP